MGASNLWGTVPYLADPRKSLLSKGYFKALNTSFHKVGTIHSSEENYFMPSRLTSLCSRDVILTVGRNLGLSLRLGCLDSATRPST